jgi:hypothetical protein
MRNSPDLPPPSSRRGERMGYRFATVAALVRSARMSPSSAARLVEDWERYVRFRMRAGDSPESTAAELTRFERQQFAQPWGARRDALRASGSRSEVRGSSRTRRMRRDSSRTAIGSAMLKGIEDALWLPAWADSMEEAQSRTPRHTTRETAAEMPPETRTLARQFAAELVRLNRGTLPDIHARASEADGRQADPKALGYYLTMQAIGHGVGWTDDHEPFDVRLPYLETLAFQNRRGGPWGLEMSMTRGKRSREIGSGMRRRWHGTA